MGKVVRETLKYFTDKGDEIALRIDYSPNLSVTPKQRYELGGFDLEKDRVVCGLVLNRKILDPRIVIIETEKKEILPTTVKTLDKYLELLDNPHLEFGKIIKRRGEKYNRVCSDLSI